MKKVLISLGVLALIFVAVGFLMKQVGQNRISVKVDRAKEDHPVLKTFLNKYPVIEEHLRKSDDGFGIDDLRTFANANPGFISYLNDNPEKFEQALRNGYPNEGLMKLYNEYSNSIDIE